VELGTHLAYLKGARIGNSSPIMSFRNKMMIANNLKTLISINNLTKKFDDVIAVDDVSLAVYEGEFMTFLGPSGSGKTTILNILAGFEKPSFGDIHINGQSVADLPPFKRNIGMVFQNYALFPHMTISENLAFPLTMRKFPKEEIKGKINEILSMVRLQGFGDRYPKQLSGGQQQRVAG
jgi:putative spermidine/putrescine transport system ATP-binding protein